MKQPALPAKASADAPVSIPVVQTSAQPALPVHSRDEFTGIGGTYVRDPVTGLRTRVD